MRRSEEFKLKAKKIKIKDVLVKIQSQLNFSYKYIITTADYSQTYQDSLLYYDQMVEPRSFAWLPVDNCSKSILSV